MVFNGLPNWVRVRDRFGDWKRGRETWMGTGMGNVDGNRDGKWQNQKFKIRKFKNLWVFKFRNKIDRVLSIWNFFRDAQTNASLSQQRWPKIGRAKILQFRERIARGLDRLFVLDFFVEGFSSLFPFFFFFKELVAICAADWVSNLPCPIDSWPKQRLRLFTSKRKTATDRMDVPDLSSLIGEELGLEKTNASLSQQRWPEIGRAKILQFRERIARADWVSNLPCPIDSWPKQRLPLFASKRKTATDRMDFPDLSSFIGEELGLEKVGLLAVLDAMATRASCPIGGVPQTNVTMVIFT
ncbi:hypothetical protein F2Q70_00042671 [Brassica cretica]|uniref:Uncharacterized protein n=1 Tax=Brassica cretica TaxID=69181 RepID=A0A8S9KPV8_BRACR|nr:hypothetical protein F2Q70_00042671 [Brassica cretica]